MSIQASAWSQGPSIRPRIRCSVAAQATREATAPSWVRCSEPVGVGVELLIRSEGHERLEVDPLAFGQRQCLLVGKEEAVREAGSDRVAHVALPRARTGAGGVLNFVCVLGGVAHGEHAAHADDHASGLLGKGGALGIEEAERFLWP